jgi:hypothetical protein
VKLVDALFDYLQHLDNPCLSLFLQHWPLKPYSIRTLSPRLVPVVSYLPKIEVDEKGRSAGVIKILQKSARQLCWGQTYTAEEVGDAFLQNYGWTECIGLRGPVKSDDIACGFLLLGPDTEYPRHSHEAEEIYVPFSSTALWTKGKGHWAAGQRGVPIHHEPGVLHGVRTGSAPLLALYLWRGKGLDQKSRIEPR